VNDLKVTGFHPVIIKGWIFIMNITNDDTRGSHGENGPKTLGRFLLFVLISAQHRKIAHQG
jgi:hypothetical protein